MGLCLKGYSKMRDSVFLFFFLIDSVGGGGVFILKSVGDRIMSLGLTRTEQYHVFNKTISQ